MDSPIQAARQIELRPLTEADLEFLRSWRPHPEIDRWLEQTVEQITPEAQSKWWEKRRQGIGNWERGTEKWFGIWVYEAGPGGCGYFEEKFILRGWAQIIDIDRERKTAEVGLVIAEPEFRNQGIGTAALRELLSRCQEIGLHSVIADILPCNIPSMTLFLNAGFRPVMHLPGHCDKGDVIRWTRQIGNGELGTGNKQWGKKT